PAPASSDIYSLSLHDALPIWTGCAANLCEDGSFSQYLLFPSAYFRFVGGVLAFWQAAAGCGRRGAVVFLYRDRDCAIPQSKPFATARARLCVCGFLLCIQYLDRLGCVGDCRFSTQENQCKSGGICGGSGWYFGWAGDLDRAELR